MVNKKAGSYMLEVMVSTLIVVLTIFSLYGCVTKSSNIITNQGVQDNSNILVQINQELTKLDLGEGFSFQESYLGDKYDSFVYDDAKWSRTKEISFVENEYVFLFSKGSDNIALFDRNVPQKYVEFERPDIQECKDRACICYVSDLELWHVDEPNGKKILELEEINNNLIKLENPNCISASNQNSEFVDSRGYLDSHLYFDSKFNDLGISTKRPISLEVFSLLYFDVLSETENNIYFFNQFNNLPNKKISERLFFEQYWNGGLVLGGYGYSRTNSIENGFDEKPEQIYLTKYHNDLREYSNYVGVTISSLYSMDKATLETMSDKKIFIEMNSLLKKFKPYNLDSPSMVKEYYSRTIEFNPYHFLDLFGVANTYEKL